MSQKVYNVAVIGAGEVAMVTHLPTLVLLSHMYRTVALVDVSKQALEYCAHKFHVPATYTDVEEMLRGSPEVDLVLISSANEYHVAHTVQSLRAGKHVLVEKPISLTKDGADEIEAVRIAAAGPKVFVGYMRRFAPAFLQLKEVVKANEGKITHVVLRDVIGPNKLAVAQGGAFPLYPNDFPPETVTERQNLNDEQMTQALGEQVKDPIKRVVWRLLIGLGSHDVSALRELFGMPQRALAAGHAADGMFVWAVLQYSGFVVHLQVGMDLVQKFDAHVEVFMKEQRIRLQYDNPYIKGLPITLTTLSNGSGTEYTETISRPTFQDPYTYQFESLYESLTAELPIKTTALDARQDLEIFEMMMKAM